MQFQGSAAHVVMPWALCAPTFLRDIEADIERRFGIAHTTIQIEPVDDAACRQSGDQVV